MCLEKVYTERTKRKYIKLAKKKGYLKVYKVMQPLLNAWRSQLYGQKRSGLAKAKEESSLEGWFGKYFCGFHCFVNKKDAKIWPGADTGTVECLIHPDWIQDAGKQIGACLVTSYCFFPTYPDTKAKVKDFRKAIKKMKTV